MTDQINEIGKDRDTWVEAFRSISASHVKQGKEIWELRATIERLEQVSEEKDRRIRELTEVLTKVQKDVNWMTNEGKLLNRFVFDYIDKALNTHKP